MRFNLTFGAAVAAAALTFALPAASQPAGASGPPAPGETAPPGPGYGPPRGGGRGFGRSMTLAQYQARFRDRIMQADADHDGRVNLVEWTAYRAERGGEGAGGEGQGGGGRRGGGGFGDPTRQFQMMDANHDGYVTPAEIDAVSAERFARLDANHDGVLTRDERRAMRGGGMDGGGMGGGEPTQPLPPPQ